MPHPVPPRDLAHALRASASRAADLAEGGCALVFAAIPGDSADAACTRLRAAAGFAAADSARAAAQALHPRIEEAVSKGEPATLEAVEALGARGRAATLVLPLCVDEVVRGVLCVGLPRPLTPEVREDLEAEAERCALRLDRAHLRAELDRAGNVPTRTREDTDEAASEADPDELLRMSEALFAQDIELLRNNEKIGKIEKLKNDFIEKMSRELRTPLNSIIEAIIGVLAGENDAISDQAKSSLRTALDEGTAFQRTLQNILDLWRIKQNELPVEIQEVNVAEVVEEAIFSVQDTIGTRPVTIEKQVDRELPKLRTDLAKVSQLLFLLLDNAVKFTPAGRVRIAAALEGERLVCEVEDSGIGLCPDDQQYVFDEFFQVDANASSTYRGAGLGLSLVRELVALLEGELSLESEAGKGTRVRFEIPAGAS